MSKNALKKLKRQEREAKTAVAEEDRHENTSSNVPISSIPSLPLASSPLVAPTKDRSPLVDPSHLVPPTPSPVPLAAPAPLPLAASALPLAKVPPPRGAAGELLAMLMTTDAPTVSPLNGNSHHAATSSVLNGSKSSNHPTHLPEQPPQTSYFKSKSGFTIRL